MSRHTHPDPERVAIACPSCVDRVKAGGYAVALNGIVCDDCAKARTT